MDNASPLPAIHYMQGAFRIAGLGSFVIFLGGQEK